MNTKKSYINSHFDGAEIKIYKTGDTLQLNHKNNKNTSDMVKYIHTHFTFEIFFVTKGELTVISEEFVKSFSEGVIIIPPQFKHCTVPDSNGCFCLLFSVIKGNFENINEDTITTMPITDDVSFYIKKLAEKIDINPNAPSYSRKYIAELLFDELSELVQKSKTETIKEQLTSENISRIEEYINTHLNFKFTLADVAKKVFLSTRQISRIIKKEYGKSFVELVIDKKMAKAEMCLKNTNMTIKEIAISAFPDNANYFYTVFKKKHGMTPLNYRKQMKSQ